MSVKTVKIRFIAQFHKLNIKKNFKFQTKIEWRRQDNKTQTELVNHTDGTSVFNQNLALEIRLNFNEQTGVYEDKNTAINAIICFEEKIKSGGKAKYNIAQVINNDLAGKMQTISLVECPDPNANVQVTFHFEPAQGPQEDMASVLNSSVQGMDFSRVDFSDDKLARQMERINQTILKFSQLSGTVKRKIQKPAKSEKSNDQSLRRIESLQTDKNNLQKALNKAQLQLQQTKTQQKQSKASSKQNEDGSESNYKLIYQQAMAELAKYRRESMSSSLGFGVMEVNDVHEVANFGQYADNEPGKAELEKKMEQLRNEKFLLEEKLSEASFKMARIFNAATEIGGAKLLDALQTAIGLTEH